MISYHILTALYYMAAQPRGTIRGVKEGERKGGGEEGKGGREEGEGEREGGEGERKGGEDSPLDRGHWPR